MPMSSTKKETKNNPAKVKSEMKFEIKTLPSGVRYIFIPIKQTETVTAMILVGVGSEYETKNESGLSHFLEHMCFKGTKNYPSYTDLFFEFDKIGSHNNAFTSGLVTGYYAKSASEHAGRILELVTDIYLHPIFPEVEVEKEKGVITQEINMYEDDPQSKVDHIASENMYGDQPAGRSILGTKQTVASFTRNDLIAYRTEKYVPDNTLIVVAGNFNEKEIGAYIKKHFSDISNTGSDNTKNKKLKIPKKEKTKIVSDGPKIKIFEKKTDQTHFILTFHAFDLFDKRVPDISILATLLGSGMSSRLHYKVREELGLCYYIHASASLAPDYGTFVVRAGVGNDQLELAINAIVDELNKIKLEIIQEAELQKAKEFRISGLVLNLETPQDWADFCGAQLLVRGKIEAPSIQKDRIRKVTAKQVREVAKSIFKATKSFLAVVGPHKKTDKLKSILARLDK